MKLSYFPVIFNISIDGTTAVDITRRSMVTKQSLSRTIKELQEKGIITTKADTKDKRSERLCLTQEGKEWVLEAHVQLEKLTNTYIDLVGEKDLKVAATVLAKIIAFHEQTDTGYSEEDQ
jgi:DNA-binding MarR family transcriptional regulator